MDQAIESARSIADVSRRVLLLGRIGRVQEKAGRSQDAVGTYKGALRAVDSVNDALARHNFLIMVMRGTPGRDPEASWIAAAAPQLIRIVQSIDERRRAEALVLIARALPN